MAHAALVSLHTTITRLLNSSRISIVSRCTNIEYLCNEIDSLLLFLIENSSTEISCSKYEEGLIAETDRRIMEAVHELEDGLESEISTQILSQYPDDHESHNHESYPSKFTFDLQQVDQKIDLFNATLNKIMEDLTVQVLELNGDADDVLTSKIDFRRLVLAYDALISVMKFMDQLFLDSNSKLLTLRPKLELVYKDFGSLKLLVERSSSSLGGRNINRRSQKVIDDLNIEIKVAIHGLEHLLQFCKDNKKFWSQYLGKFITESQEWELEIELLATGIRKIEEEYNTTILGLSKTSVEHDFGRYKEERSSKNMAYGALISLMEKIEDLYSSSSRSNIVLPPCPKIEIMYNDLGYLQLLLEKSSNIVDLDRQIREATFKLINALVVFHDHISYQTTLQLITSGDDHEESFVQKLDQEIDFFISSVGKIKEEYSSFIEPPSKMVGLDYKINHLKDELIINGNDDEHHVVSIFGMVGSGKTTLVRHVYEDQFILSYFQRRAWVTIGPKYQFEKVMSDLLRQLSPGNDDDDDDGISGTWMLQGGESSLLYKILRSKRYLIVFDDIWDTEFPKMFKRFFPDDKNRSRIVITTRIQKVTSGAAISHEYTGKMPFLNKEESWLLFREKAFGKTLSCPSELEKVAKKIVENCEGLPLAIIIVGKYLSESEKTLEFWTNVAEKQIPVFDSVDDEIHEVIFSSYKYLPSHLKPCFLYMGIFPRDSMIESSKLLELWIAEGLFQHDPNKIAEGTARQYFEELVSNSLVMVRDLTANYSITTGGIHYIFQHMLQSEASKTKLLHIIDGYDESFTAETLKGQRRICIHNNVLFGINKDVHKSMVSNAATMRSLLCTGEYHPYPVPIMCSDLSLLIRVLDALSIRFYQFPFEMSKLVRLRYLTFTYDGELPSSISKFWDLQYLIIGQHVRVVKSSTGAPRYLPVEIWNMKELKHLEVKGSELPDPPCGAGSLPNLSKLIDVSFRSCTDEVLKGIPNLKMLRIRIELEPDVVLPLHWCNDLGPLDQLIILECNIVNPNHTSRVVAPFPPFPVLPSSVRKLRLSGFGYPWEYLSQIIGDLSNLQELDLQEYAFRGPKLELTSQFSKLKSLRIADTDLEYLGGCCASLSHLYFWHCYKLKGILNYLESLYEIQLLDCNPAAVESAKEIKNAKGRFSLSYKFSF